MTDLLISGLIFVNIHILSYVVNCCTVYSTVLVCIFTHTHTSWHWGAVVLWLFVIPWERLLFLSSGDIYQGLWWIHSASVPESMPSRRRRDGEPGLWKGSAHICISLVHRGGTLVVESSQQNPCRVLTLRDSI